MTNLQVNRARFICSLLALVSIALMPAVLMGQAPTIPGLPEAVTGVQSTVPLTGPVGPTYSTETLSSPLTGTPLSAAGSPYNVWCFNPFGYIQSGAVNYTAYSSYDANFLSLSGAAGPGATPATAWQEVNWVINHKHGQSGTSNPTIMDIQYVIWDILIPGYASLDPSSNALVDAAAQALYNDATQYGPGFIPAPGQLMALALYVTGINQNQDGPNTPQDVLVEYPVPCPPGKPGLKIVKSANVQTAKCTDKVTYSYTVTNTGNVTLTNIVVTDDNGTPKNPNDDFTVGTIASLAPGKSVTLTASVYLPVTESAVDANGNVTNHTLIKQVLPNGDIQVTLLEDANLIDNTYGFSASPDWNGGNNLWNHIGADSAEFQFIDGAGNVVLDFAADYLSLAWGAPLGLATGGVNGGAGQLYWGNPSYISSISTTLSDSLNRPVSDWGFLFNAPPPGYSNNWKFQCGYTVVIKQSCFGKYGFGDCKVKTISHQKCKLGNNYQCHPVPVCTKVTNVATATVTYNGTTLTATAQATVTETDGNGKCTTPPPPKCQPTPCRPQDWWNKCNQQWQGCKWW